MPPKTLHSALPRVPIAVTSLTNNFILLFELVWQVRNDILQSKDSIGASRPNAHLTEQLLHFKYNADMMLQYGDRNQIDYPRVEIQTWTRARKSGLLKWLKRLHKRYLVEQLLETKGQRSLTTFGFTTCHDAGNRRGLDDPSTGDGVT